VAAIPHLGASTEEAENNCAIMAVRQVRNFPENGDVKNSVNFPDCELPRSAGRPRMTFQHPGANRYFIPMNFRVWALLFCAIFFANTSAGEITDSLALNTSADSAQASDTTIVPAGSMPPADVQEEEYQQSLDSLFAPQPFSVDTFAWSTTRINSGHHDFAQWADTARIVLVDSAQKRRFVNPFTSRITSNFGQRRWLWHYGIDIKLAKGDTVCSAFDGVVRVTQYDRRGYGNVVVIRHQNGLETVYGHLSAKSVAPNQQVAAGEMIGLGGNTGHSTGSHLHFEIRYYGEPIDPNYCINFADGTLKSDILVLTRANFEYLIELRKAKWYRIRKGDTLGHIAMRSHTSVRKLCALNHITARTLLRIGRKIRYQ